MTETGSDRRCETAPLPNVPVVGFARALARAFLWVCALPWVWAAWAAPLPADAQEVPGTEDSLPVVNAVLFFSPTCPHCHELMENTLPPIQRRFGDRLRIVAINTATRQGQALFRAAFVQYRLTSAGVPMLVVGDRALIGGIEIPVQLPGIVEEGLAAGGIDWPALPGLRAMIASTGLDEDDGAGGGPATSATTSATTEGFPAQLSAMDRFRLDPAGNGLSVAVLLGMLAALAWVGTSVFRPGVRLPDFPPGAVPLLALAGLGVASYLAFVEVTGGEAVCGPVGDCNTVQQSSYANLFGVIPVGLLGVGGYVAMAAAWFVAANGPSHLRDPGRRALLGMAALGTALSAYLTFLEPFVIGATCMWCLSSAVIVTLILITAAAPRLRAGAAGSS